MKQAEDEDVRFLVSPGKNRRPRSWGAKDNFKNVARGEIWFLTPMSLYRYS